MKSAEAKKPLGKKLTPGARRAVSVSPQELIGEDYLYPDKPLPWVVRPAVRGVDLAAWAGSQREFVESRLVEHGAVLFRDFDVRTAADLEAVIDALCGGALEYRYRASPRSRVSGNIYTSTDYPADQHIFPHNEHAYSPTFPVRIFFFCETPAPTGGETPVGSCRRIYGRIDPRVAARFVEKRVMYVRNFGDGFGLPWQSVFQTESRAEVEEYCRARGIECEWKGEGRLRTRQVGPAVVRHPRTGEAVWFNHATFFHVSTVGLTLGQPLSTQFDEADFPTNTYYGDGSPIEPEVLEHLRRAYLEELVVFPWQKGDVLYLDNMLAVHGRRSYTGERRILVGMAEPHTPPND